MRRKLWAALLVVGALLAAIPAMAADETKGVAAGERNQVVEVQVVIGGKVEGRFSEVSGLSIGAEPVSTVCRVGEDDDCDGTAWQAAALRAVWGVAAAAENLERSIGQRTGAKQDTAKHDTAMNAIRNVKAIARKLEESLIDPAATLKTKHDTAKNSINNVRFVTDVLTDATGQEDGPLAEAVRALQAVGSDWVVRYRPGRPTYGNITLTGPHGSASGLLAWYRQVLDGRVDRKSGSVIFLDRSGAEVARYNFFEAWPCRYSVTTASEQIELAVESTERAGR